MNKFKIGDKVKNTIDYQTFTIKEIKGNRYSVEENVYLWSDEFLIPVKKTEPLKESAEKELAERRYLMMRHFHNEAESEEQYALAIIKCEPTWDGMMLFETCSEQLKTIENALIKFNELKNDVARFLELDSMLSLQGFHSKEETEEYQELRHKLTKVGK